MLNPSETAEVGPSRYARCLAVKEGLVQEEDEEPADAGQDGADPESPWPGSSGHNERGDEWSQVGAQNDGELDVVDDSWMLVEEEEILDPHQGPSLPHTAEEAIYDARSKVGVEARGGRRPDACTDHDGLEDERDWQASKEAGESDDEESACSNGEEVTHNRVLHVGRCQVPLPEMTSDQSPAVSGQRAMHG